METETPEPEPVLAIHLLCGLWKAVTSPPPTLCKVQGIFGFPGIPTSALLCSRMLPTLAHPPPKKSRSFIQEPRRQSRELLVATCLISTGKFTGIPKAEGWERGQDTTRQVEGFTAILSLYSLLPFCLLHSHPPAPQNLPQRSPECWAAFAQNFPFCVLRHNPRLHAATRRTSLVTLTL